MDTDKYFYGLTFGILISNFILLIFLLAILVSCTVSFQNISTHGVADDLVDEQMSTTPDVKTDLSLPFTPGA